MFNWLCDVTFNAALFLMIVVFWAIVITGIILTFNYAFAGCVGDGGMALCYDDQGQQSSFYRDQSGLTHGYQPDGSTLSMTEVGPGYHPYQVPQQDRQGTLYDLGQAYLWRDQQRSGEAFDLGGYAPFTERGQR